MHDLISAIGVLCLVILLLIFLLKKFHQPYLIAYILAGVLLGRHSLHVLADGDEIQTLETTLKPFKVFFTALFFVALGLMVDIPFIIANARNIFGITALIPVVNSLLSAVVFRMLKYPWKTSLPAGALLSQTGEFSLIACTLSYKAGVIDADVFKGVISVIVLTLLLSTPWALAFRKFIDKPIHPLTPKKATSWP